MKKVCKYYVLDSLTESVVGSFFALNDDVAKKVVIESVKSNEKLKQLGDSLKVIKDLTYVFEYETYDEVMNIPDCGRYEIKEEWMKKEE